MQVTPRRSYLRSATASAHADLEAEIGHLGSLRAYTTYLRAMLAFRAPLEGATLENWRPTQLAPDMIADLADLATDALPAEIQRAPSGARLYGALYVVEGATLGARLLCRDMATIGLTAEHGARHLWRQAAALENWRAFLAQLEGADLDLAAAAEGANATFAAAKRAILRARHG